MQTASLNSAQSSGAKAFTSQKASANLLAISIGQIITRALRQISHIAVQEDSSTAKQRPETFLLKMPIIGEDIFDPFPAHHLH